jgi:hypothetical protein
LAIVAALAFVVDGAFGAYHHRAAASAGASHDHAHVHSHGPVGSSHHHHAGGHFLDASHDIAAQADFAPTSGVDVDACSCLCASCAAVVLPWLNVAASLMQSTPSRVVVHRRHSDGVEPDGPRKPPKPIAIA